MARAGWTTDFPRVEWDGSGLLTSVWDIVAGRQVLADNDRGNLFSSTTTIHRAFDAWDVDRAYLEQVTDLVAVDSIEILERHPLRGGVRFVRSFGASTITQTMRLAAGTTAASVPYRRGMARAAPVPEGGVPVGPLHTGDVRDPARPSRTADRRQHQLGRTRFEVCGHRWADLVEPGYGVALLNESKYGYDILGHTIRLSLLRAPGFPDPEADQGSHHLPTRFSPRG